MSSVSISDILNKHFAILSPDYRARITNIALSVYVATMAGFAISIGTFAFMPHFIFMVPMIAVSLWIVYELLKINDCQTKMWQVIDTAEGGIRKQLVSMGASEEDVKVLQFLIDEENILAVTATMAHIYHKILLEREEAEGAEDSVQEEII